MTGMQNLAWRIFITMTLCIVVAAVVGCANMMAPRNMGDSIAYMESQVQGVVRTCATLNDERRITLPQARQCKSVTDQAFAAVDLARTAFRAGDLTNAQAQLTLARSILIEAERIAKGAAQ